MKIMMVSCSALPCHNSGVAQVIHHVAGQLIKKGHQVYVFTLTYANAQQKGQTQVFDYEGYEVCTIKLDYTHQDRMHAFTEANYKQPDSEQAFNQYVQKVSPDVVHFHSIQGMGANMLKLAKDAGCSTVLTMHDWWWLCPNSFMADSEYRCCHQMEIDSVRCIACIGNIQLQQSSEQFIQERQDYLLECLKVNVDKIFVVSNYLKQYVNANMKHIEGIEVNLNGVEQSEALPRTNHEGPVRLAFLGGIQPLKGYELLQEACQYIESDNWELHIYSVPQVDSQGFYKAWNYLKTQGIKSLTHKLKQVIKAKLQVGEGGRVHIHPPFETCQKEEVFSKIDILLSLSTVKESSSLVVREALIRGIPVLTTASGGPLEVVLPGENGEVVDELAPQALAQAIDHMLRDHHYQKLKQKMQCSPYQYTYVEQAQELEETYKTLIKGGQNV